MSKNNNNFRCKNCKKYIDVDDVYDANEGIEKSNKNCFNLKSPNKTKKPKKIHELNNLVVITNKDSLFDNFMQTDSDNVNYDLIMKKILLPYYKIKSRIMKKGMYFKIGEIGFKVIGVAPFKKGVVTSKTYIHCNSYYSLNTPIKRALLLTTTKFDNFDQEALKREVISWGEPNLLVNKNEISHFRQFEFFVRNCEPDSGVLTSESQITIENKDILNIAKVKIAIIKVDFCLIFILE